MNESFTVREVVLVYGISEDTVANWIKKAKKYGLETVQDDESGKAFIINNEHNRAVMAYLTEKGEKKRNKRTLKTMNVNPEFYKTFNEKMTLRIISELELHREIDFNLNLYGNQAKAYDDYILEVLNSNVPMELKSNLTLLENNFKYIINLIKDFRAVNVVDLTPGNGVMARDLLSFLVSQNRLRWYIPFDQNPSLSSINQKNIREWVGKSVPIKSVESKPDFDSLSEVLFESSYTEDGAEIPNIILIDEGFYLDKVKSGFLLESVRRVMKESDILVIFRRLDNKINRVAYGVRTGEKLFEVQVLELMGVNKDYYEVSCSQNDSEMIVAAKLKYDLDVNFEARNLKRRIKLDKGEEIVLWRYDLQSYASIISNLEWLGIEVWNGVRGEEGGSVLMVGRTLTENK